MANDNSMVHIDGLVQDYSNSIAKALELLQSCTKPSICIIISFYVFLNLQIWRLKLI